jgi:PAS domain S-box-containing protein
MSSSTETRINTGLGVALLIPAVVAAIHYREGGSVVALALLLAIVVVAVTLLIVNRELGRGRRDKESISRQVRQESAGRQRAEQSLLERQELLTRIVETVTDGIYVVDRDGRMAFANAAAEHILGVTRDELAERSFNDEIWAFTTLDGYPFPEDEQPFVRVMRSGQPVYGVEQCFSRPDGTRVIVSISAAPLKDTAGAIVGEVATLTDITARMHEIRRREESEEALRKSVATNRALLDAIPDLMLRISSDGVVVNSKEGKDGSSGVLTSEVQGKHLEALLPPPIAGDVLKRVARALDEHEIQVFEYQLKAGTGVREFEARLVVSGEQEVLAIIRDISERKATDRLKNEFISTVSHELRTPLTSILSSLGLVTGGVAGEIPPKARAMLDIAHKNSERLVRLINDILDTEKIESGKVAFNIVPIDLMPHVAQAIEANRTYGEQLGVRFELTGALPGAGVRADSDRLTQVMTNLLSNAAKFSPRGNTVTVSVSRRGELLRIAISDHGPGIPPEFQSRIFQKFAQADSSDTRQKGGTGLGLSISKAIVERLGGQIGFETAAGKGTTFYVDLPEWRALAAEGDRATGSNHRPRVLVCEDDADIATLLRMMLEQGGFNVETAMNAAEARQALAARRFDGMTLDLMLPDEDGISLIRDLREHEATRHLPIVVVSVKAQQGRAELNGDAFLVVDWIDKPIDHARLIHAVREAVAQRPGHRLKILHVEDDPDIVRVVAAILLDTAEVECAASLGEAMRMARQGPYDLVILDLGLPDGSGLDLLPLLRGQTPPVPVVVFSAHEVREETAQHVAAALVKSRASNDEVIATIKASLQPREGN